MSREQKATNKMILLHKRAMETEIQILRLERRRANIQKLIQENAKILKTVL